MTAAIRNRPKRRVVPPFNLHANAANFSPGRRVQRKRQPFRLLMQSSVPRLVSLGSPALRPPVLFNCSTDFCD